MALDLAELLAPVSEDEPAGPDLAYDSERYEIEQAFETEVSIDASGVEASTAEVDWRPVINKIADQSRRTKDVWLAVYLCRAGVNAGQLEVVETGAQYLAGLLEQYWPTVHPQLEEYGFQGRKGACDSLAVMGQFVIPLRKLTLLSHPRLGSYSGADFERFRSGGDAEDGYGMFRAALQDVSQAGIDDITSRLDAIEGGLRRADLVLTSNSESGSATNFQPTYDALKEIRRAVQSFGSNPAPVEETVPMESSSSASAPAGGSASDGPRVAGRVESREDVLRALEAIADYYRRREPSHPILGMLGRVKEWVGMDFIAILEDIAPGSIDEVRSVLQHRSQRDS